MQARRNCLFHTCLNLEQRIKKCESKRIKKRIHSKQTSIVEATQLIETNIQQDQVDTEQTPVNALAAKNIETTQLIETNTQEETPDVKQYWEISNGRDSLYDIVIQTNPLMVQYIMSQL